MSRQILAVVVACCFGVNVLLATVVQAAPATKVVLSLNQVRAVDECGGLTEWGHDKITIGAVVVERGKARVRTLNAGKFGHDNSTKNYRPPQPFITFSLRPGETERVHAYLVLAERDALGGFGKFLDDFRTSIQEGLAKPTVGGQGEPLVNAQMVQRAAALALTTGIQTATAVEIGRIAYDRLKSRFKDDIFSHHLAEYVVAKPGKPTTATFRAPDCRYTVTYSWSLQ